MGFNCGIVGLPNVGKSTLFNALTQTASAQAANYPFCTIEPNVGRVSVPDDRLTQLAQIAGSAKIIPTQIEFVDIAGLVKGASKGEGLGNQFLAHIRQTDAILHVLRCFDDSEVTHVEGRVNPLDDAQIIETELLLADLESIERRLGGLEKRAKGRDEEAALHLAVCRKLLPFIQDGLTARLAVEKANLSDEEKLIVPYLQLITTKPVLYVCNVAEGDVVSGNAYSKAVADFARSKGESAVCVSAAIEAEIASLDEADRAVYLAELGLSESGLDRVIRSGYDLLGLMTFFTIGPKEARAWTVRKGTKAPQAAGVIHTDFELGFICSETVSYEDYVACKGEAGAKTEGKWRQEGREYIMRDGDVVHFRFNR